MRRKNNSAIAPSISTGARFMRMFRPSPSNSGRPNIFTALLFLLLTPLTAAPLHAAPPESFLLFYSNSLLGEIDPCG
jgi:hypothetical protein